MTQLIARLRPEIVLAAAAAAAAGAAASGLGALPEALALPLAALQLPMIGALALHRRGEARARLAALRESAAALGLDAAARPAPGGEAAEIARRIAAMRAAGEAALEASIGILRQDGADAAATLPAPHRRAVERLEAEAAGLRAAAVAAHALERDALPVIAAAAAGDFSRRVPASPGDAATGRLAEALNDMLARAQRGLDASSDVLAAIARDDLRARMKGDFQGAFGALQQGVNDVADGVETIVTGILAASGRMRQAQEAITAGAADLADRTNAGATAVEETSAAMEEISVTTAENARKAQSGRERADQVATSIEEVRHSMQEADTAVRRIQSASEEIEGIVTLIDSIAFQTRLLALNASVEAARAGEAGRGFAVVASEVRNLAERVVSASGEIKGLVEQSGGEVRQGSVLVERAAAQLAEILELIRVNAADMREIAAACGEQANAVGEISTAVAQLEEATSQNAALVDRTGTHLKVSASELDQLERIIGRFVAAGAAAAAGAATGPRAVAGSEDAPATRSARVLPFAGNTALDPDDWSEF